MTRRRCRPYRRELAGKQLELEAHRLLNREGELYGTVEWLIGGNGGGACGGSNGSKKQGRVERVALK